MTGSLINNILPDAEKFDVGDGATVLHWTDRTACTVIAVSPSGKTITLQADHAYRTDTNGMSDAQKYRYERDLLGATYTARRNRRGEWKVLRSGQRVVAGRRSYHDFSF